MWICCWNIKIILLKRDSLRSFFLHQIFFFNQLLTGPWLGFWLLFEFGESWLFIEVLYNRGSRLPCVIYQSHNAAVYSAELLFVLQNGDTRCRISSLETSFPTSLNSGLPSVIHTLHCLSVYNLHWGVTVASSGCLWRTSKDFRYLERIKGEINHRSTVLPTREIKKI